MNFSTIANGIATVANIASKVKNLISGGGGLFDSGRYSTQKYNEIEHDIDLYLDNSGDFNKPKRYFINPAAVLGLQISDTVNDWVVDGSITILYSPEGPPPEHLSLTGQIKKTIIDGFLKGMTQNAEALKSYTFRGDGLDLLRVMIIPNTKPGINGTGIQINKNNTKWMLSYAFSIYDVEDVNDIPELEGIASSYIKCLTRKFHDVRYQMLKTINLEYSTSTPKDPSLTPNFDSEIAKKQGVLYTGDILKDIFNEVLAKPENGGHPELKITPETSPWDKGKGEFFYTSPAQWSAEDDIDYVYAHHVSEKELKGFEGGDGGAPPNDLCLLHTERSKVFGRLEPLALTPLTDFFKKAGSKAPGELQKEHFFVTAATNESDPILSLYKAPISNNSNPDIDLQTSKYGQIISYSFVDMSAAVNSTAFTSTPVYSVDIGKREFYMEFKGNDIQTAKKVISKSYISEMYKRGSANEEKLFLPVIHKNKKDLNIFPTFSLHGNNAVARQRNGLHSLIYTGLFQNACICFKVYGLTWRESGTFIGIDKLAGSADNDYNNKLYGQWFVVRVDHIFENASYVNVIYAIKLHSYDIIKAKFENTLTE